jgi:hypothetical protein
MTKDVAGVALKDFEVPVHDALQTYQEMSEGSLQLDLEAAPHLELTPDKPTSASSATDIRHLGETIGKLFVIAFAPYDGTGDESTYSLDYLGLSRGIPKDSKIVPRSKAGIQNEIHLALAGKFTDVGEELVPYAGHLDIIGFNDKGLIGLIGSLGQNLTPFVNALESSRPAEPTASLTIGKDIMGTRAGDPHAVYNGFGNVLQLAGFIAITDEMAAGHASLAGKLGARFRV